MGNPFDVLGLRPRFDYSKKDIDSAKRTACSAINKIPEENRPFQITDITNASDTLNSCDGAEGILECWRTSSEYKSSWDPKNKDWNRPIDGWEIAKEYLDGFLAGVYWMKGIDFLTTQHAFMTLQEDNKGLQEELKEIWGNHEKEKGNLESAHIIHTQQLERSHAKEKDNLESAHTQKRFELQSMQDELISDLARKDDQVQQLQERIARWENPAQPEPGDDLAKSLEDQKRRFQEVVALSEETISTQTKLRGILNENENTLRSQEGEKRETYHKLSKMVHEANKVTSSLATFQTPTPQPEVTHLSSPLFVPDGPTTVTSPNSRARDESYYPPPAKRRKIDENRVSIGVYRYGDETISVWGGLNKNGVVYRRLAATTSDGTTSVCHEQIEYFEKYFRSCQKEIDLVIRKEVGKLP